jgi:hypothetical protein
MILIGVVLLILIIVLRGWWTKKLIIALGGYVNKEVKVEIDTVRVKGKIDSSAVFTKWVETKGIILNPEPEVEYIYKENPLKDVTIIDSTYTYKIGINDSILTGIFTIKNNTKGKLLYNDFNYKPKIPYLLTRVDTLKITKTITETLDNFRGKIGIGIGYNNLDYLSISAGYTTKKGWQVLGEYGKATRDIKEVINGVPFKLKRDDLLGIKIIKNF